MIAIFSLACLQVVKIAINADSDALCMLRQRQARMYAGLARTQPLASLMTSGNLVMARTTNGKIVIAVPVDHIVWTDSIAQSVSSADSQLKSLSGVTGRELWVGGTVSPRARKELETLGWAIHERAAGSLVGPG